MIPQDINPIPNSFRKVNAVRMLSINGRLKIRYAQNMNCKISNIIAWMKELLIVDAIIKVKSIFLT